ncbi:ATP-grasp domain-containing protein [Streptomyces sp. UNOC14_S4]|uniref:ATP-grasp domain-containing protein n=1 Tax=Streptomyces sp. UNOC14_S4 TaxID=2872340 RepID=UPI001E48C7E5|nr:ATP-grasp domain-containing protein [Streptomyces sp. UNOC14_S4]MCC3766444.1 ATP-grasp domain-containing protein [Streptomyces sp. UNOC14_S4]
MAVIVDGHAMGNYLPAAFARQGVQVIHVFSDRSVQNVLAVPDLSAYLASFDADGDEDALVAELRQWSPICVTTGSEMGVEMSDRLSEKLGLEGNGTALSAARRDKYEMLEALRRAGIRCVQQFKGSDPDELADWAERLASYPVVVKPMSSTGSDGVHFCADRAAVVAAAQSIQSSADLFGRRNAEVLVQERMDGTEYIVDAVSGRGRRFLAGVWRYEKRMLESGRRIYDKDVLLASDEEPAEELASYVYTVLDALGIDYGAAHAEVMMTDSGPMLVEVAARMNGNSHPEFHSACMDANQADLVALAAVDPDAFIKEYGGRKYQKRTEAIVHNASTTLNGKIEGFDRAAIEAVNSLEAVFKMIVKPSAGAQLIPTEDLSSSPLRIFMAHESRAAILDDYQRIQQLKDRIFLLS